MGDSLQPTHTRAGSEKTPSRRRTVPYTPKMGRRGVSQKPLAHYSRKSRRLKSGKCGTKPIRFSRVFRAESEDDPVGAFDSLSLQLGWFESPLSGSGERCAD